MNDNTDHEITIPIDIEDFHLLINISGHVGSTPENTVHELVSDYCNTYRYLFD